MKLLKLRLQNFKGIKDFTITPEGHNMAIYGTNATGKTTIADALCWLLLDKPSTEEKNFSPKPRNVSGEEVHHLESEVEGVFSTDSGNIILTKIFRENWKKIRGSISESFSGHVVEYAIDGVTVPKNQYDDRVNQLVPQNLARLLMSPMCFAEELPWPKRRELLLQICGDVSGEEVIQADPELEELRELLQKPESEDLYTVDDYRAIAKSRMKKANERLQEIPARIDEATKSLSGSDDVEEYLLIKRETYQKSLIDHQRDMAVLRASGAGPEIKQKIRELQMDEREARANWEASQSAAGTEIRKEAERLSAEKKNLQDRLDKLTNWSMPDLTRSLERMRIRRDTLSETYKSVKAKVFEDNGICPCCGQALPEHMVAEAMAKFNEDKSKELTRIREQVEKECSKPMIEELSGRMNQYLDEQTKLEGEIMALEEKVKELRKSVPEVIPFESTGRYIEIRTQIKALQEDENNAELILKDEVTKIQTVINSDQTKIDEINRKLSTLDADHRTRQRIQELKMELEKCGAEYETCQRGLDLCDLYTKTRISMLDNQINSKFKTVSFQLFEDQINGGIKECCKVLVPSPGALVRYESANNAARINAGLEIIDTLAEHFGYSLPVFVDNAESVVELVPINTQVIRLVVSEADKKLRMEVTQCKE